MEAVRNDGAPICIRRDWHSPRIGRYVEPFLMQQQSPGRHLVANYTEADCDLLI